MNPYEKTEIMWCNNHDKKKHITTLANSSRTSNGHDYYENNRDNLSMFSNESYRNHANDHCNTFDYNVLFERIDN